MAGNSNYTLLMSGRITCFFCQKKRIWNLYPTTKETKLNNKISKNDFSQSDGRKKVILPFLIVKLNYPLSNYKEKLGAKTIIKEGVVF